MNPAFRAQLIQREHARIDEYESLQIVGNGTYGQVSIVRHRGTGQTFALKEFFKKPRLVVKNNSRDDDREKEASPIWEGIPRSATREFALLLQLDHPNIVRLFDFVCVPDTGTSYLVMERAMMDISNFFDLKKNPSLRGEVLDVRCVKRLMFQILSGVHYLHSHGIMHRDLKPSNLLFCCPEGASVLQVVQQRMDCIKITDFGLARQYFAPAHSLQFDGVVVSLYWRAPELLLGARHYGPAIDMWSVGCIFAQFFRGGRLLFLANPRDNPEQLVNEQLYRIFQVLGKPSSKEWPDMESLPSYRTMIQDSPPFPRLDYDRLGLELRHDPAQKLNGIEVETPARTKEFLQAFLQINPANRITADEAIRHPYFADILNS